MPAAEASNGTVSPESVRASAAEKVRVSTHRATSPRAWRIGLPASRHSTCAKCSDRSATRRAARSRTRARSTGAGGGKCSAAPPVATSVMNSPEYGLRTSVAADPSTNRPPRNSPVGRSGAGPRITVLAGFPGGAGGQTLLVEGPGPSHVLQVGSLARDARDFEDYREPLEPGRTEDGPHPVGTDLAVAQVLVPIAVRGEVGHRVIQV